MEYRSLFDTDTDTLLSEITSLEQQQGMYINPQHHVMSNYSSQPTPQQMQQSHIHNHQFINTNHYPDNRSSNANAGVGGGGGGGGPTTNNQSMPQQQNTPNNNSNTTTTATTTIQNVQINVQNNFNIAKNMQQGKLERISKNSHIITKNFELFLCDDIYF